MKLACVLAAFISVVWMNLPLSAQSDNIMVGIFIYDGVEVLDFSGPAEVFAATEGFEPFLVAISEEPIISQGFIQVTPQYSIHNCPRTDIIVFPGGGTGKLRGNEEFMNWVSARADTVQIMMSVCTGAAVLSAAGLLDSLEVTTWYGFTDRLQQMTPKANVLTETRFVDNGNVLTTAGVSAGIDGALHVVSRIKGENVARATAQYMEYDKWHPEEGKVIETEFIRGIRSSGLQNTLIEFKKKGKMPQYYFGEIRNLGFELIDTEPAESEAIFHWLLESYPDSPDLYDGVGRAMEASGEEAPVSSSEFLAVLESGNVAEARRLMSDAQRIDSRWMLCSEGQANVVGYQLLQKGQTEKALDVLKWNTELYPDSPNAWDSLADGYEARGDIDSAIKASRSCLSKLNGVSDESRKRALESASHSRIERLSSGKQH